MVDHDLAAAEAVEHRDLPPCLANGRERVVDAVGLQRVPGEARVHVGTLTREPV